MAAPSEAAKPKKLPFYGGQAVIEGVMMRGTSHFAVACRRASGEIQVQEEAVPVFFTRYRWAKWPFMRGVFALADAMALGMKSLTFSSNLALEDEQEAQRAKSAAGTAAQILMIPLTLFLGVQDDAPAEPETKPAVSKTIATISITGAAIFGMLLGMGLFLFLPNLIAFSPWVTMFIPSNLGRSLLEGFIRVVIVLGYITLIGRMAMVERIFQYHGAEHKAINALESTGTLDLDAAADASRLHPRCGTNFVLTVLMIKIIAFALLPVPDSILLRLGYRLMLLPVVASIGYEIIRLAGTYRNFAPLQWIVLPGLLTQKLTTREPERGMLEVALASLRSVLVREGDERAGGPAVPDEEGDAVASPAVAIA